MQFFYTAKNAKVGDVIPFYNEKAKRFDNFYLKNWNPDCPKEEIVHGWHKLSTSDHIHFTEEPAGIYGGTGSIVETNGLYHMFYCTFEQNPDKQYARHATSTDLTHWTDIPEEKFGSDGEIYLPVDWRDPHVIWNADEQKWWMLLAARENAPTERNGCVALCVSDDLHSWEYRKPLYAPRIHQAAHECPDFFRIGDWCYLVYSNYTDGFCTYYRMSRSPNGPWLRPEVDSFDGRAFYAAKTGFDGKRRFLYGWNPTRGENLWKIDPQTDIGNDYKTWNWGGAMEVHEIVQHADGTLGVKVLEEVDSMLCRRRNTVFEPVLGSWETTPSSCETQAPDGMNGILSEPLPALCKLAFDMTYRGAPTRLGVALQMDESFSKGYYFAFEPGFNRIQFRTGLRMEEEGGKMFPYAVEMERPLKLAADRKYSVTVVIQDSVVVLYVNNDLAFSARMYQYQNRRFGFFVSDGAAKFENVEFYTE